MTHQKLPETIDLWANLDNGVAEKLSPHLEWEPKRRRNERGPYSWKAPRNCPEDWFEYHGHAAAHRRVLNLGSENDINEWRP